MKLSRYLVASDLLSVARTGFEGRVIFPTRTGRLTTMPETVWQMLQAGQWQALDPTLCQRLQDARVLVAEDEDEFSSVVQENIAAVAGHDVLYQVVQPSAWCQLDCSYCGQEHSRKKLSETHQRDLLDRIRERLASGRYRQLKIGWFGAEPLAGLSVMRSLGERAQLLAREFGCDYSARIVTNGMALTPEVARELSERHQVREAEVTLDGLADQHDRLRFTKTGQGSFAKIFANLQAVCAATELGIVVRCNVDRHNAAQVEALIEAIAGAGLAGRVRFYTSPVYAWGNDADQTALGPEEFAQLELEWLALQLRLGFEVGLVPPRRPIVCLSVQRQGEVTDAYGSTFNCTEVPYVPAYGTPNQYQMAVPVHTIHFQRRPSEAPALKLRDFNQQLLAGEHQQCAACRMLPVCGGHCPKSWHEGHAPCPSAKRNMPDRLNLLFAAALAVEA
ncbi:radical SAM protein [Chitinimonas lacunae]|uniref:Radical SAM protein n=1 Tax=Chitinimonas lacunae TaxID=1963018 RepID=A0ABV8MUI5_9NEIS